MNYEKFYEFWNTKIKGKSLIDIRLFTESYFHLYGKQYVGPTCSSCIGKEVKFLKDIFIKMDIEKQKEIEKKEIEKKEIEKIEEIEKPKTKTKTKNDKVKTTRANKVNKDK